MEFEIAKKQKELEEIEAKITHVTGVHPNERRFRRTPQRRGNERGKRPQAAADEVIEDDLDDDENDIETGRLRSAIAKHRRMFGVLMGTLESANQRAEKTVSQKKFEEIDQRLQEQNAKEREESKQERIQLFLERRAKRAELLALEQEAQLPELIPIWEQHYNHLKCGIRTKSSPHVFFLPAKHDEKTKEMLTETTKDIQQLIDFHKGDYWKVLIPARLQENDVDSESKMADTEAVVDDFVADTDKEVVSESVQNSGRQTENGFDVVEDNSVMTQN
eukprot:gene8831-1191_t